MSRAQEDSPGLPPDDEDGETEQLRSTRRDAAAADRRAGLSPEGGSPQGASSQAIASQGASTNGRRAERNGGLAGERLEAVREALRRKRSEIMEQQETQLSALYAPDKHHLADLEEMASDTVDTDSLCALVDIGSSTLAEIDAALLKLDEGTYGVCELCEEPIHPERLEILPFAALCIQCQRQKEGPGRLAT